LSRAEHRDAGRFWIVSALALAIVLLSAADAGAYIYWDNNGSIARANLDGSAVEPNFISGGDGEGVAVDEDHVYWADAANGRIGRANIDGTNPQPNFITGLVNGICGLAVDAEHIYWGSDALAPNGTVGRADIDGTDVSESFVTGADLPCGVAVDASYVYWANLGNINVNGGGQTIGRAELDGDSPNQSFITAGPVGTSPCGVAVNPTSLFFSYRFSGGFGGTTLGRADIDGSDLDSSFITGATTPCGVAVDSNYVYWVNSFDPGSIGRAELDGESPNPSFITTGVNLSTFVAVDPFPLGTSTALHCAPGSVAVAQATECTVTVTATGGSVSPEGSVAFSSPQGSFGSGGSCILAPSAPSQSSCSVAYTPVTTGTQTVTATLPTGNNFTGSSDSASVEVAARSSATSIRCAPADIAVGQPSTCTVTVADSSAAGAASAPTGSVALSAAGGGLAATACSLASSGPGQSSCAVTYAPRGPGAFQVSADYEGDATHAASADSTQVVATRLIQGVARSRKKGTARLIVVVPGPGALTIAGRGIAAGGLQAAGPGEIALRVKATGKTAKRLRRKGKASVTATVTFTPAAGASVTDTAVVRLLKRR
jgi:virginiamycin B lyase